MRFRTRISSYGGVYPIPLYTKPASCGGSCIFCPRVSRIPCSYILNEDTLYAQDVGYSPAPQFDRLTSRIDCSHGYGTPLEVILLGGSFSALEESYRRVYMSELYAHIDAMRSSRRISFLCSIITVESRPDQITQNECDLLRELGVSKVEIGVQHVEDHILRIVNRGHLLEDVVRATDLLKRNGFKVGYHVMLGLPGANYQDDCRMLKESLWRRELSPDFLKIYPCELLRDRRYQPGLWEMYDARAWHPPESDYVRKCLTSSSAAIPRTVRISRIMRQFEQSDVLLPRAKGLHDYLRDACKCIRCREAGKSDSVPQGIGFDDCAIEQYQEIDDCCIQVVYDEVLIALARVFRGDKRATLLRELHVYGHARKLGTEQMIQGRNIGSRLLEYVEDSARSNAQQRMLVNASIGAHGFFLKKGYHRNTAGYLQKTLQRSCRESVNYPTATVGRMRSHRPPEGCDHSFERVGEMEAGRRA